MTSYQPKPGDRVKSPLLVGEWEVICDAERGTKWWTVERPVGEAFHTVDIFQGDLSPVAPPLPPEPRVGSVVRAHGKMWLRQAGQGWYDQHDKYAAWPHLAAAPDFSAVAPVEDIADWLWDAGIRKVIIDNMRFAFGGTETT